MNMVTILKSFQRTGFPLWLEIAETSSSMLQPDWIASLNAYFNFAKLHRLHALHMLTHIIDPHGIFFQMFAELHVCGCRPELPG